MKLLLILTLLSCVFGWKCEGNCNPDPSSTWTAPSGWNICRVEIKAGLSAWAFNEDGCQDGYCVTGIGTQAARAERICGESPSCKEISHTTYYITEGDPAPTPEVTATPILIPTFPTPTATVTAVLTATPQPKPTGLYSADPTAVVLPTATLTPNPWPTPSAVPITGHGFEWNAMSIVAAAAILGLLATIVIFKNR